VGTLVRTSKRYAPDAEDTDRASATLLALVRNEEVDDMVASMIDLERTWNNKFNYPWTFFNDKPFSEEFKKKTSAATNAKCNYGTLLAQWLFCVEASRDRTEAN
jgi:mannosyltransferase